MLEGVRVIEFATMIAGPTAGGFLAEWGADVIKIEPHEGCRMRGRPGSPLGSTNFDLANRGKRGLAIETSVPGSREVILRLIKDADIFITNLLPERLEKLALDYKDLQKINPRLVYSHVTGFGRVGPDKNRRSNDITGFWARGGPAHLLSVRGADPVPYRQSIGDRLTGMGATGPLLAAYIEAQRTGKGRLVETSLMRTGIWTFGTDISNQLISGRVGSNKSRFNVVMPLSNYYKTKDEKWLILHSQLAVFAPAVGREDLLEEERFTDPKQIRQNGPDLVKEIDAIMAEKTLDEWRPILDGSDITWEPMQSTQDVVEDPQAKESDCFVEVPNPGGAPGTHMEVSGPAVFYNDDGSRADHPGYAHSIGQHSEEILKEAGYADAEIEAMRESGALLPKESAA